MVGKDVLFFLMMRGQHGLAQRYFIVQGQATNCEEDRNEKKPWRTRMVHTGTTWRTQVNHTE